MKTIDNKNDLGFLSIKESQEALDCSRGFLYQLAREGKLKRLKINSKVYFRVEELRGLADGKD